MSSSIPRPSPAEACGPFPIGATSPLPPVEPDRSLASFLYNHNPFYVISAVLMLYAVRSVYGELQIGAINCWIMMGVLSGYTALLAAIGVVIVRWGRVWEDARSIFVLILLLFLAVSVSADDLFVRMESSRGAALLLICGYLFSALVTELVLRGSRLEMRLLYRLPLHAILGLFYVAPWFCASLLEENRLVELQWRILMFPVAGGLLLLSLVPAARRGPSYVAENGSPWRWPLYPWTAFGALTIAIALRTFALCMTFGPIGPIWIPLPASSSGGSGLAISYDTMWGPYFLIPVVLAVMFLFLEGGLATGNNRLVRRVLWMTPVAILTLALPWSSGPVHASFLRELTQTVGSPVWLSLWLLVGFYGWSWLRGLDAGRIGILCVILLFTVVTPTTITWTDIAEPHGPSLVMIALLFLADGIRVRSSRLCFLACLLLSAAQWQWLPQTSFAGKQNFAAFHTVWLGTILLGLLFRDEFAAFLRATGALLTPLAAVLVIGGPWSAELPWPSNVFYLGVLALISLALAWLCRSRWYLFAFGSLLLLFTYGLSALGYRAAARWIGRAATIAFVWSTAALLAAFLISSHKAGWVGERQSLGEPPRTTS